MIRILAANLAVGLILVGSEYLWRKKIVRGEYARKLIHILVGCFVAFMPFWLSYSWIIVFAFGAIALSILNNYHHFFKAGLSVKRRSYGDLLLAAAMLVCAAFQPNKWIFMAAILHVSLADGFAAVVGTYFDKRHKAKPYTVLKHKKTVAGTVAFIVISFLILLVTIHFSHLFVGVRNLWLIAISISLFAAALENVGVYGTDNILLPVFILLALSAFKS